VAGGAPLVAGALNAVSEIAKTIKVSLAAVLLVVAYNQRSPAGGQSSLVGRLAPRRLRPSVVGR
jgi:hypothetical protein